MLMISFKTTEKQNRCQLEWLYTKSLYSYSWWYHTWTSQQIPEDWVWSFKMVLLKWKISYISSTTVTESYMLREENIWSRRVLWKNHWNLSWTVPVTRLSRSHLPMRQNK